MMRPLLILISLILAISSGWDFANTVLLLIVSLCCLGSAGIELALVKEKLSSKIK